MLQQLRNSQEGVKGVSGETGNHAGESNGAGSCTDQACRKRCAVTVYSLLNLKAKENLINAFADFRHKPSPTQLAAVLAIQETLTSMLSGHAAPVYYLSSLDPGMGKTTAILTWLKVCLKNREAYGKQGVLIALDRHEEIERYITDAKLPADSFAVLAGNCEVGQRLNSLGLGAHGRNKALILFTTKQQIRNRCYCSTFADVKALHYNGQPRRVKVWDESFTIGEEVVMNPYQLGKLLTVCSSVSPEITGVVMQILNDTYDKKTGEEYLIPELPVMPKELENGAIWATSQERDIAKVLWRLSGQPVTIHRDEKQQILVDCTPSIPDDFAPCLILDASARLKATYELQHERRQDIIPLAYSNKSYRNLEVSVWARKSGKSIINDMKAVLPELVKLFTERKHESFLVVLHKDHKDPFQSALSKQLTPEELDRVKFCTWARHTATNEFSDISNIIMLSPYQFPDYAYEATTRAATAMTTAKGRPIKEHISRVKKGEVSSNILQAVNRGKVRKAEGDTCPPCRLWLITHPNTGIAKELPNIFPDCKVQQWKVNAIQLTAKKQRLTYDHLQELLKQGVTEVLARTVREYFGFKGSASNFTRDVINQPAFKEALTRTGWTCVLDGIFYVFRHLSPVEPIEQASFPL